MIDALSSFTYWLWGFLQEALEWSVDFVLWIPRQVFSLFVDGLLVVVDLVPVPDWVASIGASASALSGDVAFWLGYVQADVGLAIWISSSAIRFTIRRIPGFG